MKGGLPVIRNLHSLKLFVFVRVLCVCFTLVVGIGWASVGNQDNSSTPRYQFRFANVCSIVPLSAPGARGQHKTAHPISRDPAWEAASSAFLELISAIGD